MAKRIILFLLVNMAIMLTVSTVLSFLGVGRYLTPYGLDYTSLALFCLVWGMVGAFASLLLSRVMAKFMMGVQVIDPQSPGQYGELVQMVHRLAQAAGLPAMPEVGVYDSPEVNAFATGPSRSRALVAVSTGILARMDRDSLEAVLGHEITHVANGDMVTMTLLQGIVNAFVMFFARVLAFAVSQALSSRDSDNRRSSSSPMINWVLTILFEIVFNILGMIIISAFSRHREFRADEGGANLAGRQKMIRALRALGGTTELLDNSAPALSSFKISGKPGFAALFASHPPLEERIARLEQLGGRI